MQWTDGENAGFTTGKPWLKVNANYTKINAESQMNDPESVRSFYKKLIALRRIRNTKRLLFTENWNLYGKMYII